ncbi:MAG: 3'(2'),5'-bisphosphate nucleotidase CysQ [Ancalomicrobiaceae bacterium]|nr:3'(2'),5'-bisphosphate nucleotidase CysQ [Ancalomicrobiaceae bacterium]
MPAGADGLGADVVLLAQAVVAAGKLALSFYGNQPQSWTKQGNSPVTEADIAADRMLKEALMAARPGYGWLSEETTDTAERLSRLRLFVVDPIDGTRAFMATDPRWTVSAAVIEGDRPIAAALYQPVVDDLMLAAVGRGACRASGRMTVGLRAELAGARLSGPKRLAGAEAALRARGAVVEPYVPSLALRIAQVADARVDATFASDKAYDWDLAAADLILAEAGGRIVDADGNLPIYNRPNPRHPPLTAAGPGLIDLCRDLLGTFIAPHTVRGRGSPHGT